MDRRFLDQINNQTLSSDKLQILWRQSDFHRLGTQRCPSIHDQSDELLAAEDMWLALFTMQAAFRRDLHFENGQFVLIFEKQEGGGSNLNPNLNMKLITVVRI